MSLKKMKNCTVVISKRPLLCEGLRCLINEVADASLIIAPDEETAELLCTGLVPDMVIIDRPSVRANEQTCLSMASGKPTKVIVLGWDDNKLAVYSCERVMTATVQNLLKEIHLSLNKTGGDLKKR